MESEPPYQYVWGNPVNRVDPSGFFSSETIEDSYPSEPLDRAFSGRPGLYWLLRNAKNNNYIIIPLVLDFYAPYHFEYPLRYSLEDTEAQVYCEDNVLKFDLTARKRLSLEQYLKLLDNAARQESGVTWWRDKTVRLPYYFLIQGTKQSFFDDLAGDDQLPDYISSNRGGPVPIKNIFKLEHLIDFLKVWKPGAGASYKGVTDRYGRTYGAIGVGFGIGVDFSKVEGYSMGTMKDYATPEELENSLTGIGFSNSVGIIWGGGGSAPFVNPFMTPSTTFFEYSYGVQAVVGVEFVGGWTYSQREPSWHWLEDAAERNGHRPHSVPPQSEYDRAYSYPEKNECSCDSP